MNKRRSKRRNDDLDYVLEISDSEESYTPPSSRTASPATRSSTRNKINNRTPRTRASHRGSPNSGDEGESWASQSFMELWRLFATVSIDALRSVLRFLKKPLTLAFAVYIGLHIFNKATNTIERQIHQLLIPVCHAPVLGSLLPLCPRILKPVVDPDYTKFIAIQRAFEPILALTSGAPQRTAEDGSGSDVPAGDSSLSLSYGIRNSEAAVRDLAVLVKLSDLPSKEALGKSLNEFVGNAKETARGLQRLGAKVGGAVDSVLAMDEYVLRRLEEINRTTPPSLPSSALSLQGFIDRFLPEFLNSAEMQRARNRDILVSNFLQASNHLASHLQRLIMEAEASLALLNRLEENVDVMNELTSRESILAKQEKDKVLADLWTILGGNRDRLQTQNSHIELLTSLSKYRKEARNRVSQTVEELIKLQENLEELRGRVVEPGISTLSAEASEKDGPGEGLVGGVPLEVHMDSIRKGVLRLTSFRQGGLQVENERLSRMIADGGPEPRSTRRGLPSNNAKVARQE